LKNRSKLNQQNGFFDDSFVFRVCFVSQSSLLSRNMNTGQWCKVLVLPAKVFEIKEKADLGLVAWKLKDFREEESYETEQEKPVNLVTEILDLKSSEDSVTGVFSRDFMRKRYYRRNVIEAPVTEEASFWIAPYKERMFAIVLAPSVARGVKKLLTNYVANKFSKILFIEPHAIVEATISHETLKELHERNPQATKLIWFDQIDIPGIEKLCLAGSDIVDSQLYQDYLKHGKIWYVVFEDRKRGIVTGITRNCVATLFSKSIADDFVKYVKEDILKLIQ